MRHWSYDGQMFFIWRFFYNLWIFSNHAGEQDHQVSHKLEESSKRVTYVLIINILIFTLFYIEIFPVMLKLYWIQFENAQSNSFHKWSQIAAYQSVQITLGVLVSVMSVEDTGSIFMPRQLCASRKAFKKRKGMKERRKQIPVSEETNHKPL